jgi:selenide,water dikinase
VGPADLQKIVSVLPRTGDPAVLVGLETGDDGAVVRLAPDLAVIQTLDFFMPIVDDPYDFGRIAAANSLSDVYAMGGIPVSALAILGLPLAKLGPEVGARILEGGAAVCTKAGIQIVGGHSIDDAEPKFGLSVTGRVHPDQVWRNSTAQVGDLLVLSKPLGTGTLTTGIKKGVVEASVANAAIEVMSALNAGAAEAARSVGVHAATDVTGFALLGHAIEMVDGAGLGLELFIDALPVLDGAWSTLTEGIAPGATRRNLEYFGARVSWEEDVSVHERQMLGDPQTSGGLLFAVAPEKASALVAAMEKVGASAAAIVGRVMAGRDIRVVRSSPS